MGSIIKPVDAEARAEARAETEPEAEPEARVETGIVNLSAKHEICRQRFEQLAEICSNNYGYGYEYKKNWHFNQIDFSSIRPETYTVVISIRRNFTSFEWCTFNRVRISIPLDLNFADREVFQVELYRLNTKIHVSAFGYRDACYFNTIAEVMTELERLASCAIGSTQILDEFDLQTINNIKNAKETRQQIQQAQINISNELYHYSSSKLAKPEYRLNIIEKDTTDDTQVILFEGNANSHFDRICIYSESLDREYTQSMRFTFNIYLLLGNKQFVDDSMGYSIVGCSFNTMHEVVTEVKRLARIQNETSTGI